MTPFKENITDSIDNLNNLINRIKVTGEKFDTVYTSEENIDNMLENNVDSKSGSDVTINNTVDGGKFEWEILGNCEQDTISTQAPSPDYPQDVRVVTGNNDVVVQNAIKIYSVDLEVGSLDNGADFDNNDTCRSKDYIKVLPNTNYAFSVNGTLNRVCVSTYDENKQFISTHGANGIISTDGLFTTDSNAYYIRFRAYNTDKQLFLNGNIVINYGNVYVPYQFQSITVHLGTNYLAGIGDYKDEIVGKTDDWKIVRKAHKINFKDFTFTINGEPLTNVVRTKTILSVNANNGSGISNGFIYELQYYTNKEHFYCQAGSIYLFIDKSRLTEITATAVNDYIQANNFYAYYILETPIEETITDTTLISDLNDLYDLSGYDGQTNISITPSSGNATPSLKVTGFVTEKEV